MPKVSKRKTVPPKHQPYRTPPTAPSSPSVNTSHSSLPATPPSHLTRHPDRSILTTATSRNQYKPPMTRLRTSRSNTPKVMTEGESATPPNARDSCSEEVIGFDGAEESNGVGVGTQDASKSLDGNNPGVETNAQPTSWTGTHTRKALGVLGVGVGVGVAVTRVALDINQVPASSVAANALRAVETLDRLMPYLPR